MEELFPTRTEWWVNKIHRNMERDLEVNAALASSGWMVLRFWESEVETDLDSVVVKVERMLAMRRKRP